MGCYFCLTQTDCICLTDQLLSILTSGFDVEGEKKKRCWAVMSCRSSVFRADQRLDNRGWSVFDMETNDLPFCWEGMADVWLIFGGRWWEKGKRKHSWLFFVPSLSCYHIKLETDHCSNALTGMFFFGAFQLDVSVSNNMNPGGWWGEL